MRIVAGSARGRRLTVPDGTTTRPTTDRVREATFNALFSLDAIEDATFCDLFVQRAATQLHSRSTTSTTVMTLMPRNKPVSPPTLEKTSKAR